MTAENAEIARSAIRGFLEVTAVIAVGFGLWSLGLPDIVSGLFVAGGSAIAVRRYYRRLES